LQIQETFNETAATSKKCCFTVAEQHGAEESCRYISTRTGEGRVFRRAVDTILDVEMMHADWTEVDKQIDAKSASSKAARFLPFVFCDQLFPGCCYGTRTKTAEPEPCSCCDCLSSVLSVCCPGRSAVDNSVIFKAERSEDAKPISEKLVTINVDVAAAVAVGHQGVSAEGSVGTTATKVTKKRTQKVVITLGDVKKRGFVEVALVLDQVCSAAEMH
jgi:hypothetical protein